MLHVGVIPLLRRPKASVHAELAVLRCAQQIEFRDATILHVHAIAKLGPALELELRTCTLLHVR